MYTEMQLQVIEERLGLMPNAYYALRSFTRESHSLLHVSGIQLEE